MSNITDKLAITLAKAITCDTEQESKALIEQAETIASELDAETVEDCKQLAKKIADIHFIRSLKDQVSDEKITLH